MSIPANNFRIELFEEKEMIAYILDKYIPRMMADTGIKEDIVIIKG